LFLADLAARHVLTDIVTTNFDRLIEAALDEVGLDYTVASDTADSRRLTGTLNGFA
jgi:Tfp pilus assembly PilM family ATPase